MTDIESIRKVTLGPDDVVVWKTEGDVTCYDRTMEELRRLFPNNSVMVLADGTSLDVVSPKQAECIEEIDRLHRDVSYGCGKVEGFEPLGKPPFEKRSSEPCNCSETRAGTMGTIEGEGEPYAKWDGKPMPSSVDRQKAEEADEARIQQHIADEGLELGDKDATEYILRQTAARARSNNAEEAAKQEPQAKPVIDELLDALDACEYLKACFAEDRPLARVLDAAAAVRGLRDEAEDGLAGLSPAEQRTLAQAEPVKPAMRNEVPKPTDGQKTGEAGGDRKTYRFEMRVFPSQWGPRGSYRAYAALYDTGDWAAYGHTHREAAEEGGRMLGKQLRLFDNMASVPWCPNMEPLKSDEESLWVEVQV